MKSYLQLIEERAEEASIPLLTAFKRARIPTSTYYRTILRKTELRHDTAVRVMNAIEELYALHQAREHTAELRRSGKPVNRRTIRAEFKPRTTST